MTRIAAIGLALLLVLSACGGGKPVSEAYVVLDEYSIDPDGRLLAAGQISLALDNVGELPHTLVVSHASGEVVVASDIVQPGESSAFTVTLDPGEYEFTCRIVAEFDGQLVDHYELGMVISVTVEEAVQAAP